MNETIVYTFAGPVRWPSRQAPDSHSQGCPVRGYAQPSGFHVPRRGERRSGPIDRIPARRRVPEDKGPDRSERGQVRPTEHHVIVVGRPECGGTAAAQSPPDQPDRCPPPSCVAEEVPSHVQPSAARVGAHSTQEEARQA